MASEAFLSQNLQNPPTSDQYCFFSLTLCALANPCFMGSMSFCLPLIYSGKFLHCVSYCVHFTNFLEPSSNSRKYGTAFIGRVYRSKIYNTVLNSKSQISYSLSNRKKKNGKPNTCFILPMSSKKNSKKYEVSTHSNSTCMLKVVK